MRYDVLIIGGGVIGCSIARSLARYDLRVALADAREDVAMGASRANSAIVHAGYDCHPGSAMAEMNVRGNALYDAWCEDLEVPLSRCGSLVIAFDEQDQKELDHLYAYGQANGVPGMELVDGARARELEPQLSDQVIAALWAPTGGITCPYQLSIACFENARAHGLDAYLGSPVTAVKALADGFSVSCGDQALEARYVINAAGLFADDVAHMIGDESFRILPRKGEYMMLDHTVNTLQRVIFQTPSVMGKGVLVSPTVDGNAFAGPTAVDLQDKSDTSTTPEGIATLQRMALRSVPGLNLRAVITAFAGIRAVPSTGDFVIRPSERNGRFLHAAGICSPGLTSAPAIAERMVELLAQQGLNMPERSDYNPKRTALARFVEMDNAERARRIQENPAYGRVICRCETITEAEIVEAIHRGARSLDGVKRRTRAGMGRCQGGFCSPRVMDLLARELNVPMTELTKFGAGSYLLSGKLKEVPQK